jgi:hypothetical protein
MNLEKLVLRVFTRKCVTLWKIWDLKVIFRIFSGLCEPTPIISAQTAMLDVRYFWLRHGPKQQEFQGGTTVFKRLPKAKIQVRRVEK